jgi:UDP-perosamine 4-acetyltransferase
VTLRLLVLGGGGHGKVVADVLRAAGHVLVGFADRRPELVGTVVEPGGGIVIATADELLAAIASGRELPGGADAVALGIGDNALRMQALDAVGAAAAPAIVHPSAVLSPSASLGAGTAVMPRVVVNAAARVGRGVILNSGAVVEHDCVVGDGAHVSPNATLTGNVRVGARSWVGAGAVVLPGVRVGDDARVGAGAVVTRAVTDGATVMGVPARPGVPLDR